jgi:hypothetical protein
MVKSKVSVARFLEQQIALSEKSQRELAAECGYEKPNIMTMFKTGQTKLPLNKVGIFAKALNVDPTYMLKLVLSEYSPETWEAIEGIIGQERTITAPEFELIKFARNVTGNLIPDMSDKENQTVIAEALKRAAKRDQASVEASVYLYNKTPRNMRKATA